MTKQADAVPVAPEDQDPNIEYDFDGFPIGENSLASRTLGDAPEGWRPKPGDIIEGEVLDVFDADGGQYGAYPIVEVRTRAGKVVAIHCFHTVLGREVTRRTPNPGDRIAVRYVGIGESSVKGQDPPHMYRVAVERKEVAPAATS